MGQCSSLITEDFEKNSDFRRNTDGDSNTVVFTSFLPSQVLNGIERVLDVATWKYGWRSK